MSSTGAPTTKPSSPTSAMRARSRDSRSLKVACSVTHARVGTELQLCPDRPEGMSGRRVCPYSEPRFSMRGTALFLLLQRAGERFQGGDVAPPAQAGHLADRDIGDDRVVAELLAGVDVRDVHFDRGQPGRFQSVPQGEAVVGKGPGVDYKPGRLGRLGLEEIDDRPFAVRLEAAHFCAQLLGTLRDPLLDVLERQRAVYLRLPPAQQLHVRAVNQEYPHAFSCVPQARLPPFSGRAGHAPLPAPAAAAPP